MLTVVFTSGSKGGTGKSTLSSVIAYSVALSQKKVLVVDLGEGGSSTWLTLGEDPGEPYLTDYFSGKADWRDIICLSPYVEGLYVAPSPPKTNNVVSVKMLSDLLAQVRGFFHLAFIDLPAYPGSLLDQVVDLGDIVMLLINPDSLCFKAAKQAYIGRGLVLPVLNKYHPIHHVWLDKAREEWNSVFIFPFDPALTFSRIKKLPDAFRYLKKETRKELELLAQRLSRPYVKVSR